MEKERMMRRLIRWLFLIGILSGIAMSSSWIGKHLWYYRLAWFDADPASLVEKGGTSAEFNTVKLLHSKDPNLQNKGLLLASLLKNSSLLPDILPHLQSKNLTQKNNALKALEALASEDMVDPLMKITQTSEAKTRLGILQVLSRLQNLTDGAKNIAPFTTDKDWVIRMVAADELRYQPGNTAVSLLKNLISDSRFEVAVSAAESLAVLGTKNEYTEIFSKLLPDSSWIEKMKALWLISFSPQRIMSEYIAMTLKSEYKFLAVSAMDWMIWKGDERDFSEVIRITGDLAPGIVKHAAVKTAAHLASKAEKEKSIILHLIKFLKASDEGLVASSLEGLRFLQASIAAADILPLLETSNINLSAEALKTLGSFALPDYQKKLFTFLKSPHCRLRTEALRSLVYYPDLMLPQNFDVPLCQSEEEATALGLFLYFHASPEQSHNILLKQYRQISSKVIKIRFLEMLAAVSEKISTLDLINLLGPDDLKSWERAKELIESAPISLNTPALIDGFLYFLGRQPRHTTFTVMSFTSASSSIWNHEDILYLEGEKKGEIRGTLCYEDYNSYYYASSPSEVIQIDKNLIAYTCLSPLYEMIRFRNAMPDWEKLFSYALEKEQWVVAGYVFQKIFVRIHLLQSELQHQPTASQALKALSQKWMSHLDLFRSKLKEKGMEEVSGKYFNLKETVAKETLELTPLVAKQKELEAEEKYRQGLECKADEKYSEAIKTFEEALTLWPFHSASLKEIGVCHAKMGEYDKALNFYNELRKKRPRDPDLLNNISLIYRLKGDNPSALKYLTLEIEADPTLERARLDTADVLQDLGRTEEAVELLDNASQIVTDTYSIHFKLARLYRKLKQLNHAEKSIAECLKQKPEDVEALTYKGLICFSLGKNQEAVNTLQKAIELDLANIDARLTLSEIYISMGEKKEAAIELNKILALDPQNEDAKKMIQNLK